MMSGDAQKMIVVIPDNTDSFWFDYDKYDGIEFEKGFATEKAYVYFFGKGGIQKRKIHNPLRRFQRHYRFVFTYIAVVATEVAFSRNADSIFHKYSRILG
jgi:hypothetical protein